LVCVVDKASQQWHQITAHRRARILCLTNRTIVLIEDLPPAGLSFLMCHHLVKAFAVRRNPSPLRFKYLCRRSTPRPTWRDVFNLARVAASFSVRTWRRSNWASRRAVLSRLALRGFLLLPVAMVAVAVAVRLSLPKT